MNKTIKFLLLVIGLLALVIVANITMRNLNVSKVEIEMNYKTKDRLICKEQVYSLLSKKYGDFTKYKRKEIEIEKIEEFLRGKNLIYSVDVYLNLLGTLKIDIVQNSPILRIFTENKQYYIDEEGNVCNTIKNKAADVIIANGNIRETLKGIKTIDSVKTPITYNIHKLVLKIEQDSILRNQIDQVYYDKKDGFELLPKIGDYVVKIGQMENLDEKLLKLNNLYKEGFSEFGWDNYSEIKLEFDGQVVCVRK
ncbi:MAG: hypothetical protein J6U84_03985 [Bacteroidales bacterium]|nr:hypothetical protein [Bacteroidales bacterium]